MPALIYKIHVCLSNFLLSTLSLEHPKVSWQPENKPLPKLTLLLLFFIFLILLPFICILTVPYVLSRNVFYKLNTPVHKKKRENNEIGELDGHNGSCLLDTSSLNTSSNLKRNSKDKKKKGGIRKEEKKKEKGQSPSKDNKRKTKENCKTVKKRKEKRGRVADERSFALASSANESFLPEEINKKIKLPLFFFNKNTTATNNCSCLDYVIAFLAFLFGMSLAPFSFLFLFSYVTYHLLSKCSKKKK